MYANYAPAAADLTGLINLKVVAFRAVKTRTTEGKLQATIHFKFQFDVPVSIQDLKIKFPPGFEKVAAYGGNPFIYNENGQGIGEVYTIQGWDYFVLRKGPSNFWGNPPAGAGLTFASGVLIYELEGDEEYA